MKGYHNLFGIVIKTLVHCHNKIQHSSNKPLELSMGMSDDYLQAVSASILLCFIYCMSLLL